MSGTLSPSGSGVSLIPPLRSLDTFNAADYGAALNGTTNDAPAITAAMAAASAAGGGVVVVSGTARCSSGLTVPVGVILQGALGLAGATPGPCTLLFDLAVATCVTVGDGSTGAAGLRNIFVNRAAGTIPAASKGVYVFGGYNPLVEYVVSKRHDICFQFSANGLTGGISAHVDHLYTGVAQDAHLVVDGWPEFYCSNSRFGSNGAADLTCNAYVRVTGGVVGGGPNGVNFSQCQFNQGVNNAAALLEFKNYTSTGGVVAQEWGFTGCHAEQCLTGIKSDAGSASVIRLTINQLFWNTSNPFLALNAATQVSNWIITNSQFYGPLTLAPTAQINFLQMSGNYFLGLVSITSPAATNSVGSLMGNVYSAGLTLTGPWGGIASYDVLAGGALTLTGLSGAIDITPAAGNGTRTYPTMFNGVLVGGAGVSQQAANAALALSPNGTGALQAQVTDSGTAGGNVRGANATDWQTTRTANTMVASGGQSTIGGGKNNSATGASSLVAGGEANLATANWAHVTGGRDNSASGQESRAGGRAATVHGIYGADVFSSGPIVSNGDSQAGLYILRGQSIGGAAVRLTADGAAAGAANIANIPNNTAWCYSLSVAARDTTSAGAYGFWQSVMNDYLRSGGAGTTGTFYNSLLFRSEGGAISPVAGALSLTADTTNGGLNLTFTPPASATSGVASTISGTTMTLDSVATGTFAIGQRITGTGVTANTVIVSGSGLSWVVSISQTVAATTLSGYATWNVSAAMRTAEVQ